MIATPDTCYKNINFILFGSSNCLGKIHFCREWEGEIKMKCRKFGKCSKRNSDNSSNSKKSEKYSGNKIPFLHRKICVLKRSELRTILYSFNRGKFCFLKRHVGKFIIYKLMREVYVFAPKNQTRFFVQKKIDTSY